MNLKRYILLWSLISILSPSLLLSQSETIKIIIPKAPKPIKAVTLDINNSDKDVFNRSIRFSKRYPPNYIPLKDRVEKKVQQGEKIGGVNHGRVSVNLVGDLIKTKDAKEKLKKAGFEIVKVYHLNKRRSLVSIVFTNDTLKKLASKKSRGFSGTLRLLIDKKDKIYAITNPIYITKAFLQDDFDKKSAEEILASITKEFKGH